MIDVTFTIAEPEFVEAQLLSMRIGRRSEFRKRWLLIIFYAAILAALLPATIVLIYAKLSHDPSIGLSLPFLSEGWFLLLIGLFELQMAYALFDLLTLKHVKKQIRRLFLQSRPGQTDINLKIDHEGWLDRTPDSSRTFVEWPGFGNWIEGDSVLILRRRGSLIHLLPKRALSPSELSEVVGLITSHLGPSLKVPRF